MYERRLKYLYKIELRRYLTQPGISMAVFRAKFLNSRHHIPIVKGNIEAYIRNAYRGGRVEVYKPLITNGFYYDVNSLYPYAMLNDMPIGECVFMVKPLLSCFFGFARARVSTPTNKYMSDGTLNPVLNRPFLGVSVKGETIYPLGTFEGTYFSETLKYAKKLGYHIELLDGYHFERGVDVFKSFVTSMYKMKIDAEKSNDYVGRMLAKLQMNSLYGRFGMSDQELDSKLYDSASIDVVSDSHHIRSMMPVGLYGDESSKMLVEFVKRPFLSETSTDDDVRKIYQIDDVSRNSTSSVGIAAAITAYAQIHMYPFISNSACHYTDTDSVVMSEMLPSHFVCDQLGGMKLEHMGFNGIFPLSKVYMIKSDTMTIMKFKGLPSKYIKADYYNDLYNGKAVQVDIKVLMRNKGTALNETSFMYQVSPPNDNKRIRVFDVDSNA